VSLQRWRSSAGAMLHLFPRPGPRYKDPSGIRMVATIPFSQGNAGKDPSFSRFPRMQRELQKLYCIRGFLSRIKPGSCGAPAPAETGFPGGLGQPGSGSEGSRPGRRASLPAPLSPERARRPRARARRDGPRRASRFFLRRLREEGPRPGRWSGTGSRGPCSGFPAEGSSGLPRASRSRWTRC